MQQHNKTIQNVIFFDGIIKESIKEHNPNWPEIPDHPYRIGDSGSGKTNSLFNLINQQPGIDKIYLCAKDPYETKYQFSINKREGSVSKHLNVEYLSNIDDIYKNNEE